MSKMKNFCYDACAYLSITEAQQDKIGSKTGKKPPHFCRKYFQQVKHFEYHPRLVACDKCLPNTPQRSDTRKKVQNEPANNEL